MPTNVTPQYGHLVKFEEAISFFLQKTQLTTEQWHELKGHIHAKAFTVAGATKAKLLNDLYDDVSQAMLNDETISQFRKRFDKTVSKHGWSYNGKRGWRTQVIYQNNKNTARAAGRWQQQERLKHRRPFLLYLTAGVSLSQHDVDRMNLDITNEKTLDKYLTSKTVLDKETGEQISKMPGIDLGWDYNPGQAWLGDDVATGKWLAKLGADVRQKIIPALNNSTRKAMPYVNAEINKVAASFITGQHIEQAKYFSLGHINEGTINVVKRQGHLLHNTAVVLSTEQIAAALTNGIAIEQLYDLMLTIQTAAKLEMTNELLIIGNGTISISIKLGAAFNNIVGINNI
ncbi:MAG: phage head morphogenesis protein [Psychrobium sp.]|nr:phage head morphogenesis protein [Psychrobium sp.]